MTLEAPHLDDRRFQDLVDDAKRLVQQRCPEWTDHNVSDPGVTLIETFAFMVDQLLYRLNRVPDRLYTTFLDLIGVELYPPAAARTDVTFWLAAALPEEVAVAIGTEVATARTETDEPVVFTLTEQVAIVPCELARVATEPAEGPTVDRTDALGELDPQVPLFQQVPQPGDALLIGLSAAVGSNVVRLTVDAQIEGVGVDPRDPPVAWEAWDGDQWAACEVETDTTGGFNRAGEIVVHVPRGHEQSLVLRQRAGWLRCRVVEARDGQPAYSTSPTLKALAAETIGGTGRAVHAGLVVNEIVGLSDGVGGQQLPLARRPVVSAGEDVVVEVGGEQGWQPWRAVTSFADAEPSDEVFQLAATEGRVVLGPAVRQPDGTLRHHGAVPAKGAPIRVRSYYVGGGLAGNVARGALRQLRTSIPYVDRVENRRAATGGVDGETLDEAKVRGPIALRSRGRAITAEDYEQLAREVAPEVARLRCATAEDTTPGAVRVLVVPSVGGAEGRLRFEELLPSDETLQRIATHLDERRVIGARVLVEPPVYQGITVVGRLRARSRISEARLQANALTALYEYFNPVVGGPDADGWPFGRPVHVGEVYSVLQRVEGCELVEDVRLFAADPISGERGEAAQRLELGAHALVFSYEHQIRVQPS